MPNKINAISLFSSGGIGELTLPRDKINILAANELIKQRANCYQFFYANTKMLPGSIIDSSIKNELISIANENNAKLLLATPPCQGFSTLGKNKISEDFIKDRRNFLVLEVLDIIDACDFDYVFMENVPRFIEMFFPFEDGFQTLRQILEKKYSNIYNIDIKILNAENYGIPQSRPRVIIKLFKKNKKWNWPEEEPVITLEKSIGHLPSLEPGEDSGIKWHYSKIQNPRAVEAMRHTPEGKSALTNEVYYPKKEDGTRIKGFHNTFKRMKWNAPAPTRTTFSGSISSHNNVHPGRKLPDGTYSDPRVLTLLETFIVSTIPINIDFPPNSSETFIRTLIGESIPPMLETKILCEIEDLKEI